MSTKLVNAEMSAFLERKEPEVLCIRGKWGVGKTYSWNTRLKEAQQAKRIGLERYSYVSLFGVNSLDQLKFAIFENVVTLSEGSVKADLATLDSFVNSKLGPWRKVAAVAQKIPFVKNLMGAESTALLSFLTIRDQIVCIDDLERKGKLLDVTDVLGLASLLREQRGCKVVFLLNDEQLAGTDKSQFETYLEKVVDRSLVYEPTSQESVQIALSGNPPISARSAELCSSLGVSNIRVVKKVDRNLEAIHPMLVSFDADVFKQASSSVALFTWSQLQPGEAPSLEFLAKRTLVLAAMPATEALPVNEVAWNALLDAYGYAWTDEFDQELIDGVKKGYFDPDKIAKFAAALNEKVLATKADGSFEDAWRAYHDSFADNANVALDTIRASFLKNYKYITPLNLNGTVTLFKELGRPDQAAELLKHYVDNRDEPRAFFDLESYPFAADITDPDVRGAFDGKCAGMIEQRDISAMLLGLKDGWSDDTLAALASVSVEGYRTIFKAAQGKDLRRMISGALQFDRTAGASEEMKQISQRARQALALIGTESAINARRVSRYGIVAAANAQ